MIVNRSKQLDRLGIYPKAPKYNGAAVEKKPVYNQSPKIIEEPESYYNYEVPVNHPKTKIVLKPSLRLKIYTFLSTWKILSNSSKLRKLDRTNILKHRSLVINFDLLTSIDKHFLFSYHFAHIAIFKIDKFALN